AAALGLLLALAGCAGSGRPAAAPPDPLAAAPPARTEAPATAHAPAPGVPPSPDAAAQPAAPVVVKIGVTGTDPPHGVLVAAERGYFAEQGLAVEWGRIGVSAEVMRAVALGQVDVGSGATGPALSNLVTRGAQLWLVANTNQARAGNPSLCWVVR